MIYPKFLKNNSTLGIIAPSGGIPKRKEQSFDLSLENLRKNHFNIYEYDGIRTENYPSGTGEKRASDFNNAICNQDIDMIFCATGGDFLIEMLPFIDTQAVLQNPKWIQGYSDPTSLLYYITTKLDIATIYGGNAGGFDMDILHQSLLNNIEILKGNLLTQNSFDKYESGKGDGQYNLDSDVYWKSQNGNFEKTGRLLGGCFECINDILSTKYDGTLDFIEKYKDDGIIWYFDIFAMPAHCVFNTLWKMKEMGYFVNTNCILFGRILFKDQSVISYQDAVKRILPNIDVAFDCDIGHVNPKMTLINGAFAKINVQNGKGILDMWAK